MSKRLLAPALSALALLALPGCVSVLPEPTIPLALIQLPAERAKAPASELKADVNVFPPDGVRAYNGADIAVRSDHEMVYLADVRWADSAPRLLQNAVINALVKAGGQGMVNPAQLGSRADYDLRWRIIDLSVSRETGPVRVVVTASLVDSQTRRPLAQETFSAEGTPVAGDPRSRASALATAAQSVADQVAAFAADKTPAKPQTAPN